MFCDLVDSTPLAGQLDLEEFREVMRAYHSVCAQVIKSFDGYIAQYLGDGVLVYFGYPEAHEDDPQRAVRAGLGILAELHHLNARLQQLIETMQKWSLQVRIGIHTGLVVVGEMGQGGRHELIALGEAPNLAHRLQALAEPDTQVISSTTYRLVQGFFECRALGLQSLKGISTPVPVYQVLGESGVQNRFQVAVTQGLAPLVDREKEVGLLVERWEQVKEGSGQVVLITGEAGIGKSRLVQVLKERIADEAHTRIEYDCYLYYQNSAFYPSIGYLQRLLRFRRDESPQEKLSKLEKILEPYGFSLQEVVPLFAALLSIPLPDERYPPLQLSPQAQKQKLQEAILAWVLKEAEQQPMCVIMEDLHWADPSTLELLSLLIAQIPVARVLLLLTFRPEFHPPWLSLSYLTRITLDRLPQKQVFDMIEGVAGGRALPPQVVQQLVRRADGVPLFVEELTKMVLESGLLEPTRSLPPPAIPATLQDSLMARLDRQFSAKEVAQLGATLGREFPYELIRALSPLDEETLQKELAKLVDAELLYQRGLLPKANYLFKHALIQEAAYESLLKSKRRQYHEEIAHVLQSRFPDTVELHPELVARHYEEASLIEQAIPYWQQAGRKALERSANVEAINHLTKGLALLKMLPDTVQRARQELNLQIALGPALIATKGYTASEVEHVYARARELCQQVGEAPEIFPVLQGLSAFYTVRAELWTARELGEQLLSLAQNRRDPALLLVAHRQIGIDLFNLGEITQSRTHLERGITLYTSQKHRSPAYLYGSDSGVACLSYMALAMGMLGYADQALQRSHAALTLAQELSHPFSLVYALSMAALFHLHRREGTLARERAETVIELATDHGFSQWATGTLLLQGGALAQQEQGEEGMQQIRQGLAAWQVMGAELWRPYYLALLAEACWQVGQIEEGLQVLAEALSATDKSGERWWEAELHRLKGELVLQSSAQSLASRVNEAAGCFRQAIDIARHQSTKLLELRAVMALSRLWQQQGEKEEARQMLAEIYRWFTEGFDTVDLQEARTLLEELT